jgi:hypothetical protein
VHCTGALRYVQTVIPGQKASGGIGVHPPDAGDTLHSWGMTTPNERTTILTNAPDFVNKQRCVVNTVDVGGFCPNALEAKSHYRGNYGVRLPLSSCRTFFNSSSLNHGRRLCSIR